MSPANDNTLNRPRLVQGEVLRDTYTVVEHLGSGRFADAYLVRHRFMGMQVMKLLTDGLDDSEREQGLQEAFLLSRISHPGIVRVFDANRIETSRGNHPYITMEYAAWGTLEELLVEARAGLKLDVALDFAEQIARGLGHAHACGDGIVHRDIKPGNVLLDKDDSKQWVLRIGDFGLALPVDRVLKSVRAGGTVMYQSPESIFGYETPASDVFSTGLVIYEMLTGTSPYPTRAFKEAHSVGELQRRLAELHQSALAPPSYFDPQIPEDVDAVVARALQFDVADRIPDGTTLAYAISACRHVHRASESSFVRSGHADALKSVFRLASEPGKLPEAAEALDSLLDRHPELVRTHLPHLRQMRLEIHSKGETR